MPFSKEISDGDLWLPSSKKALVDELCEAINDRASILLVGEPAWARRACCVHSATGCPRPAFGLRTATTPPLTLSVILVGLPELRDRLELRLNRSLNSRLHHRFEIDGLSPPDTGEYIHDRMRRAGCEREVFTSDAAALVHEAATGGMRDIDRIAAACLRETAKKRRKLVERDVVIELLE